jgi:hypothetical protein
MKKIIALIAFVAVAAMAQAQTATKAVTKATTAVTEKVAVLTWKETTKDLGKVTQGKPVTAEFIFTNTGKAPLVITSVAPTCGCTAGDYTKTPVEPGKTGYVKLTYNAANVAPFTKTATITSNSTTPSMQLTIKGEVIAATENSTVKPQR